MAMMDSNVWNGQDQGLPPAGEDDFRQFLDIGNMSFDFDDFASSSHTPIMHQTHHDSVDTPMPDSTMASVVSRNNNMDLYSQSITSAPNHPTVPSQMIAPQNTPDDAITQIDAQIQFLQHQRLQQQQRQLEEQQRQLRAQQAAFYDQQQQRQRNLVPPTPQSLEMQAKNQFYAPQEQAPSSGMFNGYQHLRDQQDIAFTPLVSPAVTPLDVHFPADAQFPMPSAYFSPITSPALHPQSEPTSVFDPRLSGQTTNSPVEMDIESPKASSSTSNLSKKVRKINATKSRKSNVRQSPISKPQRKKTTSTPVMKAQIINGMAESAAEHSNIPPKAKSVSATSTEESEDASVSPEALSDMPPPPIPPPRSARQSPFIHPQNHENSIPPPPSISLNGKSPATPASLFRISPRSKSSDPNNPDPNATENIDIFELPEPISVSKPQLPTIDTQQPARSPSEVGTPKTFQPLPSPIFSKPQQPPSAAQSPQLTPRSAAPVHSRKTPVLAARGSKKRASVSSVHVSPALRPKISPNIKPLLPGTPGLLAEDSASRLLASKSNYQRILEGSTVPGVTYPSELSTNLTSKRTSHKIAEQGRRNRINSALQEIATLLPKSIAQDLGRSGDEDNSGGDNRKDGKQSSTPSSKASTVELAIVYIKKLQQEVEEATQRAEEAEKKLQEKRGTGGGKI